MRRIGLNREQRLISPARHHVVDQLWLVDHQRRLSAPASAMPGESQADSSIAVVVDDGAKDVNP